MEDLRQLVIERNSRNAEMLSSIIVSTLHQKTGRKGYAIISESTDTDISISIFWKPSKVKSYRELTFIMNVAKMEDLIEKDEMNAYMDSLLESVVKFALKSVEKDGIPVPFMICDGIETWH